MAWNEPGGNNNDPWGGGPKGNQGPPDLEEVFKQWSKKLNAIIGNGDKNGKNGNGSGGPLSGQGSGLPWPLILVAVFALGVYQSWTPVDEQERGIVLQLGKYSRTLTPGLNFVIPFVERVIRVNVTKVRSMEIRDQMLTQEETIVAIELNVQYLVADPKSFALKVENPDETVIHATESALRHEVGNATLDSILTDGRSILAQNIEDRLQSYMERYSTGIQISNVNIKSARAPDQVQAAFDDVQKAKSDKDRFTNQAEAYANQVKPEARGRAQRMEEEAKAYKERIVAGAKGETSRFLQLLAEYKKAPQITRDRLYLETMTRVLGKVNKVLVDVEGGNNILYLPLDQLKRPVDSVSLNNQSHLDGLPSESRSEPGRRSDASTKGSR